MPNIMDDDNFERQRELTIQSDVPAKKSETIAAAENHANYLVDRITSSEWVQGLGKAGKVSTPMKAAIAYAVEATLEEVHASDRQYRVSDLGLLAKIATYFSSGLRPVSISVSSTAPPSDASWNDKKGGVFGKLGWTEFFFIVTALSTAGAIFYAKSNSEQITTLNGTIGAQKAHIESLEGLLKSSNTKSEEYLATLLGVSRYIGQLEGQNDAQSDQQKKMLAELKSLVGKVDKVIQDRTKPQSTGTTEGVKK